MPTQDEVKDQLKKDGELERAGERPKTIRDMLLDPKQLQEIGRAIPTAMTPERFARICLTAVNSTPKLMQCTPTSVMAACMQAAALGLEVNTPLQHSWVLPFENRKARRFDAQFLLGYRGILTLALRSPGVLSVEAREVYAADEFEYELGLNEKLRHVPVFDEQTLDDIQIFYGIVRYAGGGHYWRLVKPHTIEEHRQRSTSPDSPAWKNDRLAMSLKTVIRILSPMIPLTPEAGAALAADGSAPTSFEDIIRPDDVIDVESHEDSDDHEPERCAECGDVDGAHQDDCSTK
jgi:recombination protein RecT